MRTDPLEGLTPRQRREHERHCARYFAGEYDPAQHTGWFAEAMRSENGDLVIADRLDLDHPEQALASLRACCIDCDADLQFAPEDAPAGTPAICLACAYRRASVDC